MALSSWCMPITAYQTSAHHTSGPYEEKLFAYLSLSL